MAVAADKGVVVVVDDMGGDMQCSNHPYKNNNNPGGICAFCLQEKLGRLVSSSKSDPSFFPVNTPPAKTSAAAAAEQQHQNNKLVMLKRSKSSAASNTRRIISHEPRHQIFDNDEEEEELGTNEYSPAVAKFRNKHHRGFWSSFLHLTSASNRTSKRTIRSSPYGGERDHRDRVAVLSNTAAVNTGSSITISSTIAEREKQLGGGNESSTSNGVAAAAATSSTRTRDTIGGYGDENDSPNSSSHASSSSNSFGRKVARSRSVGCGSRSFSGAFLEKISTGFGDCSTLRRVESQRESSATNSNYHNTNNKMVAVDDHHRRNHHRHIKCGGIFGGFTMTNTGNSISNGGRVVAAVVGPPHGRSKNWGWAFASPMRAFRPPTSSSSSSSSKPDGSVVAAAPKDIWFV